MLKWLFWLILVLVFWGISRSRAQARSPMGRTSASHTAGAHGRHLLMVPCDFCQVHVPENEVVQREGKGFCCEQHYRQWTQSAR